MKGSHTLKPGDKMGPYEVVRLIGSGGMGEVYEALEPAIDRRVALKVINERGNESDEMVQRFLGEAKALAKLNHPNLVHLHAFGQIGKQYYMAMEFIDGISLDEFIKKNPYGMDETLRIFRQLLDGMRAAHEQAIIHRDLKPQNIIIDRNKNVKIIDFGIAKVLGDQDGFKTATGMFIGTLNYLPPEIARGMKPTIQADIYGLGLILYEMLTGRVPFIGKSSFETLEMIRNKPIEFPRKISMLLPESVKRLILKMTAKNLPDRYATVSQVIEDLNLLDLNEIPEELKAKSVRARKVSNFDQIQDKLQRKGFEAPEIKMIVNLACDIQGELDFDPNATVVLGEQDTIELSDKAIQEAMERFTFVRSDMSARRTAATQAMATMRGRSPVKENDSTLSWVLMTGAAVLVAAGVFWKVFLRSGLEPEVVVVPNEPTTVTETKPAPAPTPAPKGGELDEFGLDKSGRPLAAPLPTFKVGDSFTFRTRIMKGDESTTAKEIVTKFTVSQDLGDDYALLSEEGMYRVHKRNPFVGPVQVLNSADASDYTESKIGDVRAPFPLEVGKRATYTLVGRTMDDREQWRRERTCEVKGYERQGTSLGEFWTYRVECRHKNDFDGQEVFHYSPQLRMPLLRTVRERVRAGQIENRVVELIGVEPAGTARQPTGR